jgi:glycosyltransferase involved in cell wall biosynthesis
MKILSIQYGNIHNPYSHGGLANLLHDTFKRMAQQHEITCLTGLLPGRTKYAEIDGIKYIQKGLGNHKFINRLSFSIIISFFNSFNFKNYDLILIPWDRYAPIMKNLKGNCPVVLELNLEFFSIPSKLKALEPLTRFFLKRQLKKCKYLLSISEGVQKIAFAYTKEVRIKDVLPGGVSDDFFEYPINSQHEKYLLYIGRLDISHKGIDILLESYRLAEVDISLVIAGDGIDTIKVKKRIEKVGLNKKVKMVGWVQGKEKLELISHCLAVCVPSRVEGWGIVATEAAAMGKPVIGTKVVGLEESIIDGKTGILVQKENINEFSRAIKRMVQDKELREKLGNHARETARLFTWEKITEKRENFFYKVIDDFKRML